MAKIDIISGFLGAGKTTLIKKLIKETFKDEKVVLSIDALKEVILDYRETFVGKIFVGRRSGFFDEQDEKLKALEAEGLIVYKPVNEAVDLFVDQFSKQMK